MKKLGIISATKLLWQISNKKEKCIFIFLLFACLIRALAELLTPLVTACVIAKLSGKPASILFITFPDYLSSTEVVLIAFGLFFGIAIIATGIRAIVKLYASYMMNKTNLKALEFVLEYKKNFNLGMTNGEASYIIKNASEQVYQLIHEVLIKVLTPIITAIIAIIYIGTADIYASLITIATMILISLSIWFRIHYDKKIFKALEKINGKINNHCLNNIENLPFIGFFKTKQYELELLKELNKSYFKNEKKKTVTYILYWLMVYIIEFCCTISVILLLISKGNANIVETLIVVIPYIMNIFTSTENLAFIIGNCQQYAIKISRLLLLKSEPNNLIQLRNDALIPKDEKIKNIKIKNMTINIGEFFKGIKEVEFCQGKVNCLAGGSGSGKTSLINCLLGLKEYQSGEIIINDEKVIPSLFFDSDRVSLSFQGENFFDRSLAENVTYPSTTLDEKTIDLIKYFEMEEIFSRNIEESEIVKNSLSGGEKKRISFIRCLSKEAEVYIFDEPTNELDAKNVERVLEKIKELKENHIVIVVSHDKRMLEISENIIYL